MSDHKSKRKHEEAEESSNKKQKTPITERNYHSRMNEVIETATEFTLLPELVNMINEYFKSYVVEVAESEKAYAVGRYLRMTLDSPTDKVPSKCEWFEDSPDEPHTVIDVSKGVESCDLEDYVKHLELSLLLFGCDDCFGDEKELLMFVGYVTAPHDGGLSSIPRHRVYDWLSLMPRRLNVHFVSVSLCHCGDCHNDSILDVTRIRFLSGTLAELFYHLLPVHSYFSFKIREFTPYNVPLRVGCRSDGQPLKPFKLPFAFEKGHHYYSVSFEEPDE